VLNQKQKLILSSLNWYASKTHTIKQVHLFESKASRCEGKVSPKPGSGRNIAGRNRSNQSTKNRKKKGKKKELAIERQTANMNYKTSTLPQARGFLILHKNPAPSPPQLPLCCEGRVIQEHEPWRAN
jgi:hypothetical protein